MMTPTFSVIIPVFNAERWISSCVKSVLEQSYESLECVCINDGSEDDSGKILDEIAKQDSRVRVIHKSNAGVSAARNDGIKSAKGKYVIFVDADDFLVADALQILNAGIESHSPDILHFLHTDKATCCSEYKENIKWVNEEGALSACSGFVWDKVFLLDILKKNKIFFDEKMTLCEDFHFVFRYIVLCNKICYTTAAIYVKRSLPEGLCNSAVRKWEMCPDNAIVNLGLLKSLAEVCNEIDESDKRKACRVLLLDRALELHAFFFYKIRAITKSSVRKKLQESLRFPFKELTREVPFLRVVRIFYISLKMLMKRAFKIFFARIKGKVIKR